MDVGKLNAPYQITEIDPWLAPYESDIVLRMDRFKEKRRQLVGGTASLSDLPTVICTLAFTERKADGFSGNGCRERMKYA